MNCIISVLVILFLSRIFKALCLVAEDGVTRNYDFMLINVLYLKIIMECGVKKCLLVI